MTATTVRVGKCLGECQPRAARAVSAVAICASLGVGTIIGSGFILLRSVLGHIFSSDPAVVSLTSNLCWIVGPTCQFARALSCFLFLVSCFLFRVSCFLFLVSCFLFLVSCLLSLVSCFFLLAIDRPFAIDVLLNF
eukprot:SAG31_NODE_4335_length_3344_cov_2.409245_2_plen_136_part_00